jgi:hypothetical protein
LIGIIREISVCRPRKNECSLPQQDIIDPLGASPAPAGLRELAQRFLQKLRRRDQEELVVVRQLYAYARAMKDRDVYEHKVAVYEDVGATFKFKDDVADQFIPVVQAKRRKYGSGSVRSDACWHRVKRLNIRLQGRGRDHARMVDAVRKAMQRLTHHMERARYDLGYLMQLADAETDLVLEELDTEIKDTSPSDQHGDEPMGTVTASIASPPRVPSPSPPAIELLCPIEALPVPLLSATDLITS